MSRGSFSGVAGRIVDSGPVLAGLAGLAGLGIVAAFLVPDMRLALGLVGLAPVLFSALALAWVFARLSL